jgi:hypothetical protein
VVPPGDTSPIVPAVPTCRNHATVKIGAFLETDKGSAPAEPSTQFSFSIKFFKSLLDFLGNTDDNSENAGEA